MRKYIALFLCLIMMISLFSCNLQGNTPNDSTTPQETTTAPPRDNDKAAGPRPDSIAVGLGRYGRGGAHPAF